jgi:DNA processing protein
MHTSQLEDRISTLALMHTPGVGSVTIRQLISYCGGAGQVFRSDFKKLIKIPGVGEKIVREILKKDKIDFAEKEYSTCEKEGIFLHFYTDEGYPLRLKTLYDAPVVLYAQGNFDYNVVRSVGIVGTRQISDYGRTITENIIKDLIPFSPLVVSGLAYGVDITAHRACLKHELVTIGVMACGLNVVYPSVHKKTAREMMGHGGLVTENALNTKPDFMRFPARNRIIAGLSDVTIVIESGKKGGSLITAEFAQNYHREVFAVPGTLTSPQSEGCNQLIRDQKAVIFTSVEDMADSMGWCAKSDSQTANERLREQNAIQSNLRFEGFTHEEGQILALLKKVGPLQIDELSWQSGIHFNRLANLLLNFEFQGIIKSLPGKKYALI